MKKIYKPGLLLLILLEIPIFVLVFKLTPSILKFFPEKDIYEQLNEKMWEGFIPSKKEVVFMFDNHTLYLIICLILNIILIFLTRRMFFESPEDSWKRVSSSRNNHHESVKSDGIYELNVEGFISPRNFWVDQKNNESFFEVTLPGCFMGPDCSICTERKSQFKPNHDFEMYLGNRNNWVAKIHTVPEKIDDQSLSKLLDLNVRIMS
ncbi:MAG: hypothetical protein KBB86_02325 [Candidatus Pacebacteria bacterium]|nr:hypothetical protein [Candidatus Paceibacterota bacterium]